MKIVYIITNADLAGAPIHLECLIRTFGNKATVEAIFGEHGLILDKLRGTSAKIQILPRLRSSINIKNDAIVLFQLIKLLRKTSPDIVHLHSSKAGMIGRLACIILGIPWVYTVHGWGWRGFGTFKSKLIFCIEKLLSLSVKGCYLYVSKSVETTAIGELGINNNRGRVVYNGVTEYECSTEPLGPLKILMAARVCAAKDHETLVRAFERVEVASKLLLCGEGTDTESFRRNIIEWAPSRNLDIELLGVRTDVRALLCSINVFALISNFEALPISIIEAMASGRAIVATNVGGVPELIDPDANGYLVPICGIEEIARCITLLNDQQLRARFGKVSRQIYHYKFTELRMTNAVWNVYEEMLAKWQQ
jgi:glycosyltransferase involved in cell wall biosynthesis